MNKDPLSTDIRPSPDQDSFKEGTVLQPKQANGAERKNSGKTDDALSDQVQSSKTQTPKIN